MPYNSYEVLSLYFDDPDLSLFHDHSNGVERRHKYRLRAYRDRQGRLQGNVFFEKKIKKGPIGHKERTLIGDDFQSIAASERGDLDFLLRVASKLNQLTNLGLCATEQLRPNAFISYHRERFSSPKGTSEINIDTKLSAIGLSKLNSRLRLIHANFLVVEEKYEKFEIANRHLVEELNRKAYPTAFSKYMWAVEETLQPSVF